MRFKPALPGPALEGPLLASDCDRAAQVGKVRLGQRCLYLVKFSHSLYLPYSQILHAWLRQEEASASLCCGRANFDQFYLMLRCPDGQVRRGQVPDKASGQRCLDHIAAQNPAAAIGYYPNRGAAP